MAAVRSRRETAGRLPAAVRGGLVAPRLVRVALTRRLPAGRPPHARLGPEKRRGPAKGPAAEGEPQGKATKKNVGGSGGGGSGGDDDARTVVMRRRRRR